jgi:hypothetical protein
VLPQILLRRITDGLFKGSMVGSQQGHHIAVQVSGNVILQASSDERVSLLAARISDGEPDENRGARAKSEQSRATGGGCGSPEERNEDSMLVSILVS